MKDFTTGCIAVAQVPTQWRPVTPRREVGCAVAVSASTHPRINSKSFFIFPIFLHCKDMIHHVPPLPTCKITKNHGNNLSAHQFLPIFANGYFIHAFAQIAAEEKNVHCFYMDVNATRNLTEFIHYFAKTVIGKVTL